jgi:hypothetical protein
MRRTPFNPFSLTKEKHESSVEETGEHTVVAGVVIGSALFVGVESVKGKETLVKVNVTKK